MTPTVTEFWQSCRGQLFRAIEEAGVPLDSVKELIHKKAPYGSWKLPIVLVLNDKPLAKYWLTWPNGRPKFNTATFASIQKCLNLQTPPSCSTTQTPPSSSSLPPESLTAEFADKL